MLLARERKRECLSLLGRFVFRSLGFSVCFRVFCFVFFLRCACVVFRSGDLVAFSYRKAFSVEQAWPCVTLLVLESVEARFGHSISFLILFYSPPIWRYFSLLLPSRDLIPWAVSICEARLYNPFGWKFKSHNRFGDVYEVETVCIP